MTVIFGGIIKHSNGIGFKITFKNKTVAQHYKDMMIWIIKNDNHNIKNFEGYYDKKER